MNLITVIGWFGAVAGAVTILCGAYALCGKLLWLAKWKWDDYRAMNLSVVLGWRIGEMPEDEWVLVREHVKGAVDMPGNMDTGYQWALMIRRGDRAYSISGGYSTPITNITGWLRTVETPAAANPESEE